MDNDDLLRKEKQREYYAKNREKMIERQKKYYAEHTDKLIKYQKEYRQAHKDDIDKYRLEHQEDRKRYYLEHRDEIIDNAKKHYQEHKEEALAYQQQYKKDHKDKCNLAVKRYHDKNRETIKKYQNNYYQEHREESAEYRREYSLLYTKRKQIDKLLKYALSHGYEDDSVEAKLLGCSYNDAISILKYDYQKRYNREFDGNFDNVSINHMFPFLWTQDRNETAILSGIWNIELINNEEINTKRKEGYFRDSNHYVWDIYKEENDYTNEIDSLNDLINERFPVTRKRKNK